MTKFATNAEKQAAIEECVSNPVTQYYLEGYAKLRQELRELLQQKGYDSNPAVSDTFIVESLKKLLS